MVVTFPLVQFALLVPCALLVGQMLMKDEWNCVGTGGGVLSVMTSGITLMPELSVGSWAWEQVSLIDCVLSVIN